MNDYCKCDLKDESSFEDGSPCIQLHPKHLYKAYYLKNEYWVSQGFETLQAIDDKVVGMCNRDCWPERLKNRHEK